METFPLGLGCWIKRGFGNIAPQRKVYLGDKTYDDMRGTISAVFILNSKADSETLLTWWSNNLKGGTDPFSVELPFFNSIGAIEVYMENDLEITPYGVQYEAIFELKLVQPVSAITEV